ncbi:hypothetical protein RF11_06904 [Thelohanellus kitauei]|uniref:Uncharacterized protein n=1 Tax=Thelohanellus kitauei TaxID=669202 RepID=A0A0C2ISQ2_THEKT|nr:hypothetical protein RF11_06904 [Thelohanellus kitauei]
MLHTNVCQLENCQHFNELEEFIDYLKNKPISQNNYTRMIFSAQCNLEKLTEQFYQSMSTYYENRVEVIKYLIAQRNTINGTNLTDSFLMEKLEKHPVYKQWIADRLLLKVIQCYLQNDNLDKALNSRPKRVKRASALTASSPILAPSSLVKPIKPGFKPNTQTNNITPLILYIGAIAITMLVVVLIQYKRIDLNRNDLIRALGDDLNCGIRENLISGA